MYIRLKKAGDHYAPCLKQVYVQIAIQRDAPLVNHSPQCPGFIYSWDLCLICLFHKSSHHYCQLWVSPWRQGGELTGKLLVLHVKSSQLRGLRRFFPVNKFWTHQTGRTPWDRHRRVQATTAVQAQINELDWSPQVLSRRISLVTKCGLELPLFPCCP